MPLLDGVATLVRPELPDTPTRNYYNADTQGVESDIKLIRTDTTIHLNQKAEKV